MNKDLESITKRVCKRIMLFNPDRSMQALEVFFLQKHGPITDLPLTLFRVGRPRRPLTVFSMQLLQT